MIQVRVAKIKTKTGKPLWTVAVVFHRKNESGKDVRMLSYNGRFKSKSDADSRRVILEKKISKG